MYLRLVWFYDALHALLEEDQQLEGLLNISCGVQGTQSVCDLLLVDIGISTSIQLLFEELYLRSMSMSLESAQKELDLSALLCIWTFWRILRLGLVRLEHGQYAIARSWSGL